MAKHIPALDGVRGIAVGCVVLAHWWGTQFDSEQVVARWALSVINGSTGVLIFFVLSGYLITGIITRERVKTGTVSLYNFYVRRTLRIMPAFLVFLAGMAVVAGVGVISIGLSEFLSAGLYVWNYSPWAEGWWLGHTWSLAVEEQFYLIWPLLVLLLRPKQALWFATAYVVAAPAIRVASYFLLPGTREQITIMFHTRADSLLIGCAAALLPHVYPALWRWVLGVVKRPLIVAAAIALLVVSNALQLVFGGAWLLTLGYSLSNVSVVVLIISAVENAGSRLSRTLSWRPLTWLGLISYSLYLWQQPFLYHSSDAPFFAARWWSLPAAVLFAYLSYRFVEQPMLKLKAVLQRPTRKGGQHRPISRD